MSGDYYDKRQEYSDDIDEDEQSLENAQYKERKYSKLYLFFTFLGMFAGISAFMVFIFMYKLILTSFIALFSGKFIYSSCLFVLMVI